MKTISEVVQDLKYNKLKVPVWLGRSLAHIPFGWRPYVGPVYKQCKKEIAQYENMTIEERKKYIFQKVYHIVSYAIENVEFYRRYYASKGFDLSQLKSYDDIEKIPVIDKTVLLEYSLEQRSNLNVKKYITNTGGSSGQTLTFYTQPKKIGKTWAHIHNMWSRLGFKPSNARMLFVGQNKVKDGAVYEFARHCVSIDIYKPLPKVAPSIKKLLKKVPCYYLHGYPSVIAEFAEYCEKDIELLGLLKGRLRGVFLVSEYPYPMYRDVIERVFDLKTQSFYGHTEGCVMACETEEKFKFVPFQTYGFTEVIPDKSGHYSLVGTAYDNEASPLIRYDTHDLVDNPEYENGILTSFNIFEGRSGQFIVDENGKQISLTGLIMGRHHPLFDSCKHIQVCQKEMGEAIIYFVPKDGVTITHAEEMFDSTNVAIKFSFEQLDAPIRTINGKINLLVKDKNTPPTHRPMKE